MLSRYYLTETMLQRQQQELRSKTIINGMTKLCCVSLLLRLINSLLKSCLFVDDCNFLLFIVVLSKRERLTDLCCVT